jgi:hypothetical protein
MENSELLRDKHRALFIETMNKDNSLFRLFGLTKGERQNHQETATRRCPTRTPLDLPEANH